MTSMEFWDAVRRPDTRDLKYHTGRGGFTTAKAQSQVAKATELWGRFGAEWGLNMLACDYVSMLDGGLIAILCGEFYFPEYTDSSGKVWRPGKFTYYTVANIAEWAYDKSGERYLKVDTDAIKKAATDMQSKCLSKVGIDSDIFEGLYGAAGTKKEDVPVVYLGDNPLADLKPDSVEAMAAQAFFDLQEGAGKSKLKVWNAAKKQLNKTGWGVTDVSAAIKAVKAVEGDE